MAANYFKKASSQIFFFGLKVFFILTSGSEMNRKFLVCTFVLKVLIEQSILNRAL